MGLKLQTLCVHQLFFYSFIFYVYQSFPFRYIPPLCAQLRVPDKKGMPLHLEGKHCNNNFTVPFIPQ